MQRLSEVESEIKTECANRLSEDKALHEKVNSSFARIQYFFMTTMAMIIVTLLAVVLKK